MSSFPWLLLTFSTTASGNNQSIKKIRFGWFEGILCVLGGTNTPSGQRFDTGAIITVLDLVTEYIYMFMSLWMWWSVLQSLQIVIFCSVMRTYINATHPANKMLSEHCTQTQWNCSFCQVYSHDTFLSLYLSLLSHSLPLCICACIVCVCVCVCVCTHMCMLNSLCFLWFALCENACSPPPHKPLHCEHAFTCLAIFVWAW